MTEFITIGLERGMKHDDKKTAYEIKFTVECKAWERISKDELLKTFEEDWETFKLEAHTHLVSQFERKK